jgi:hypothetical protein
MRRVVFAFALLHSVAAFAQVNVGDEVVSDPLRVRLEPLFIAAPAVSIAKDRTGAAVAWTMSDGASPSASDRVYVARLGGDGQAAGAVREIPLSPAASLTHAAYPSIATAPDGNGFVLAWLEIDQFVSTRARTAYCRLDAALTPSTPVVLFPPVAATSPPLVRTKGETTWISAVGFLWTLSKNGTVSGPLTGIAASDMTIGTDLPQLVGSHGIRSTSFTCKAGCAVGGGPFNGFCPDYCRIFGPDNFALDFVALLTTSMSKTFSFASDAQPAIASNGRDVLVAWLGGGQASGGDVVASRLGFGDFLRFGDLTSQPKVLAQFPADAGETRPDIAADGERYVVVWRSRSAPANHDIVGVAIDNDGRVTPFSIATSSADERDPAILALGDGAFLVAYEKMTGTERRIAGRFVTFGRHRAVR